MKIYTKNTFILAKFGGDGNFNDDSNIWKDVLNLVTFQLFKLLF